MSSTSISIRFVKVDGLVPESYVWWMTEFGRRFPYVSIDDTATRVIYLTNFIRPSGSLTDIQSEKNAVVYLIDNRAKASPASTGNTGNMAEFIFLVGPDNDEHRFSEFARWLGQEQHSYDTPPPSPEEIYEAQGSWMEREPTVHKPPSAFYVDLTPEFLRSKKAQKLVE